MLNTKSMTKFYSGSSKFIIILNKQSLYKYSMLFYL